MALQQNRYLQKRKKKKHNKEALLMPLKGCCSRVFESSNEGKAQLLWSAAGIWPVTP